MPASSRNTEIASLLENFLDENQENLPPSMFNELDDLAEQIDSLVKEKEDELDELQSDNDEMKNQIIELEENQ